MAGNVLDLSDELRNIIKAKSEREQISMDFLDICVWAINSNSPSVVKALISSEKINS